MVRNLEKQAYSEYLGGTPHPEHLLRVVQVNIFNALARNAVSLGLPTAWLLCESVSPFGRIGPELPSSTTASFWPASLSPTPLQASEPHHPWIDLFPWPKLRDRILHLSVGDLINEDDLCHDMVEFDITQGPDKAVLMVWGEPWDPRGWEASTAFLKKWGWLLEGCADVLLEATNYWREKRGEKKFTFGIPRQWAG